MVLLPLHDKPVFKTIFPLSNQVMHFIFYFGVLKFFHMCGDGKRSKYDGIARFSMYIWSIPTFYTRTAIANEFWTVVGQSLHDHYVTHSKVEKKLKPLMFSFLRYSPPCFVLSSTWNLLNERKDWRYRRASDKTPL